MSQIRVHRVAVATLLAAVLATAPALAAPPRSAGPDADPESRLTIDPNG